ncbi:MAG: hypothetical protein ACYCW6_11370 [Candidatus Xenobia bacterium]
MRTLLILLCVAAPLLAARVPLKGLDRPPTRVAMTANLLPSPTVTSLPGHVVGVLEPDPDAGGARVVLVANGQVWRNLFVLNPRDKKPTKFPIDARGKALTLPGGVRLLQAAEVPVHLPAVVSLVVNQGHGVSGLNSLLVSFPHPQPPQPLDLAAASAACEADFQKLVETKSPHQDHTYISWDATHKIATISILRRTNSRIINTGHLPHPRTVVAGQVVAVARYQVDSAANVKSKTLAIAPVK